uniref:Reverse transcriptase domain-containing protein n=1 Tax=Mastacembelus armatus TaxID=205130 RepID=A0A3Q3MZ22_9TELE
MASPINWWRQGGVSGWKTRHPLSGVRKLLRGVRSVDNSPLPDPKPRSPPRSVDLSENLLVRSRWLRERPDKECPPGSMPSTPIRGSCKSVPRTILFPKEGRRRPQILVFSTNKCKFCHAELETGNDAVKHMKQVHRPWRVLLICSKCSGTYSTLPRVLTHIPKCGVSRKMTEGSFKCTHCTGAFTSKRGLSLHARRKHLGSGVCEAPSQLETSHSHSNRIWGIEETETLKDLIKLKGGQPGFLEEARKALPKFSKTQIRHKYKYLKRKAPSDGDLLPAPKAMDQMDLDQLKAPLPAADTVAVVKDTLLDCLVHSETTPGLPPINDTPESLNNYVGELLRKLGTGKRAGQRLLGRRKAVRNRKRMRIRAKYRHMQWLYEKKKSSAAKLILDGVNHLECQIDPRLVAGTYRSVWEAEDSYMNLGGFGNIPQVDNSLLCQPVSPEEVRKVLRAMDSSGAPGPDGVKRGHLLVWDPEGVRLAGLFNRILLSGRLPRCLKRSRTTLIPKTGDQHKLDEIGNWRPITIGSTLLRAFSGILNGRLAEVCPIHPRQRGFIAASGCSENLAILAGLLQQCKRERSTLAVVFIDFSKAFDTVSHKHVEEILLRRGVDELIRGLIRDAYKGCHTRITTKGRETPKIYLRVGVKQGDPLSPLLFNLAIDPLVRKLEEIGSGYKTEEGRSISSLAFADDLVVLSDSWKGMAKNLAILDTFSELTGLRTNPAKCHGFMISKAGPKKQVSPWSLKDTPIHMVAAHESVKYLGVRVNPWKGILKPKLKEEKLKPSQKVEVLRRYALPRLLYTADHGMVSQGILMECDRMVRSKVKEWLHLMPSTANGLLYASFRDGGLGVMKLEAAIPRLQLRRILKLLESEDIETAAAARKAFTIRTIQRLVRQIGGKGGDQSEETDPRKLIPADLLTTQSWRKEEKKKWCMLEVQGEGVECFDEDRASNNWLRDPREVKMKESEFILALQVRTQTLPILAHKFRGVKVSGHTVRCRLCHRHRETMRHLLSKCKALKKNRMANHNKICDLLGQVAKENGWQVESEKHLVTWDGIKGVPDLIILKDTQAMIIDVTLRFEAQRDTLARAEVEKAEKYSVFRQEVMERCQGVTSVCTFGFPIGVRGKWFTGNNTVLNLIGCKASRTKELAKLFSRRVILGTVDMFAIYA